MLSLCKALSGSVGSADAGGESVVVTLVTKHQEKSVPFKGFTDAVERFKLSGAWRRGVSPDYIQGVPRLTQPL